jgi:hypothetical protein
VPKFHHLGTEFQAPISSGGQIDFPDGNLRCQAQRIGRSRTMADNRLAALRRDRLYNFRRNGKARSKTAFDRPHVDPTASPHKISPPNQPG